VDCAPAPVLRERRSLSDEPGLACERYRADGSRVPASAAPDGRRSSSFQLGDNGGEREPFGAKRMPPGPRPRARRGRPGRRAVASSRRRSGRRPHTIRRARCCWQGSRAEPRDRARTRPVRRSRLARCRERARREMTGLRRRSAIACYASPARFDPPSATALSISIRGWRPFSLSLEPGAGSSGESPVASPASPSIPRAAQSQAGSGSRCARRGPTGVPAEPISQKRRKPRHLRFSSGCPDSNRGPPVPQTGALTRLRHTPYRLHLTETPHPDDLLPGSTRTRAENPQGRHDCG
jgi:hypothetical protein